MMTSGVCAQCGRPVAETVWGRRCPSCLLNLALGEDPLRSSFPGAAPPFAGSANGSPPIDLPGYEILEEIGRGGMGVVFRARQCRLNRMVAVKLLLPGRLASPEAVHRFRQEAEAAARLQHPNIVAIHDSGIANAQPYLALAWVDGVGLDTLIRDQPLAPRCAARYVQRLSKAVHYAHTRGILHRDLKPSNVLIDGDDQPRLTDFGLAKRLDDGCDLTLTGELLGTPNYMAPEQTTGRPAEFGPGTDIYSLGAILYHCLTGRPPFFAATIPDTLRQVQETEPPAPRLLNPAIPVDLETLCLKCLEKQPARRFADAQELAEELGRFLADEPIRSRAVSSLERAGRWCGRHPGLAVLMGTLVALSLAVSLLGILAFRQAARAQRAERAEHDQRLLLETQKEDQRQRLAHSFLEAAARMTESGDLTAALLWSVEALGLADGHPREQQAHRLRIASILRQCPRLESILPHSERLLLGAVTEDGKRLLTLSAEEPVWDGGGISRSGRATLWDLSTGRAAIPPLPYTGLELGSGGYKGIGVRYHPLGLHDRRIFTLTTAGDSISNLTTLVHIHDALTGNRIGIPLEHEGVVPFAEFSPDGRWIVVATARRRPGRIQEGDAQVWDVETGRRVGPILLHGRPVTAARFSPSGQRVLTACGDGVARVWELPSGRLSVPPMTNRGTLLHASFDHSGRRLAAASRSPFEVRVWDAETGKAVTEPLPHRTEEGDIYAVEFSPDDRWLLSFGFDHTARVWEATTGRPAFPPILHPNGVVQAKFSPDGRRIATSVFDDAVRLWNTADGSPCGPPFFQRLGANDVSFSPDGERLVTSGADGLVRVWHLGPAGPPPVVVKHDGRILDVRFSPDGRALLTAGADSTARVWDSDTGRPITPPLTHTLRVVHAAFSPDGRRVATASLDWSARIWDAETGQPRSPVLLHSNAVWHVAFDSTGRRLATASGAAFWSPLSSRANATLKEGAIFGEARVWDVETGKPLTRPMRHERAVLQATFSPDGTRVLTAGADRTARVWDAATGDSVPPLIRAPGMVGRAWFSPDGSRILTTTVDSDAGAPAVAIWDARTGLAATPELDWRGGVSEAYFSLAGDRVVACQMYGPEVGLWNAATGDHVFPNLVLPAHVSDVMFSPDGRWLATGGSDGVLRLCDTFDGEIVVQFPAHSERAFRVAFSPDGGRVASGSWDDTARIWTLPSETRPLSDLRLLAGLLAGRRIGDSGRMVDLRRAEILTAWQSLTSKYPRDFAAPSRGL